MLVAGARPAGVLVDRFDPWRTLMLMDGARTVLFGLLYGLAAACAGPLRKLGQHFSDRPSGPGTGLGFAGDHPPERRLS